MNTRNLLLAFLLACSVPALAQKNFKPGWIVRLNGDTLRGEINYRNWEQNPKSFTFRLNERDEPHTCNVYQLQSFEVTGYDRYLKAEIVKDALPVNVNELTEPGTLRWVRDTVFLRALLIGERVSLYELVDEKPHYFIREKGREPEELLYRIYLNTGNATTSTIQYIFRDQLKRFGADDKKLQRQINQAYYTESDLQKIVRTINGQGSVTDLNQPKGNLFRPYAGLGVSYNEIQFVGTSNNIGSLHSDPFFGYGIEAGVDMIGSRNMQRLFLRVLARYSNAHYDGTYRRTLFNDHKELREYKLKMHLLTPMAYLCYNLIPIHGSHLYVGVGAGFNITSYQGNTLVITDETTGEVKNQEHLLDLGSWTTWTLRAGFALHNGWELSVDRRMGGTYTNYAMLYSRNPTTFLVLGKRF